MIYCVGRKNKIRLLSYFCIYISILYTVFFNTVYCKYSNISSLLNKMMFYKNSFNCYHNILYIKYLYIKIFYIDYSYFKHILANFLL